MCKHFSLRLINKNYVEHYSFMDSRCSFSFCFFTKKVRVLKCKSNVFVIWTENAIPWNEIFSTRLKRKWYIPVCAFPHWDRKTFHSTETQMWQVRIYYSWQQCVKMLNIQKCAREIFWQRLASSNYRSRVTKHPQKPRLDASQKCFRHIKMPAKISSRAY